MLICLGICPIVSAEEKEETSPLSIEELQQQLAAEKEKNDQLEQKLKIINQHKDYYDKNMKKIKEQLQRVRKYLPIAVKKSESDQTVFGVLMMQREGRIVNLDIQQADLTQEAIDRIEKESKKALEEVNAFIAKNIDEAMKIREGIDEKIKMLQTETNSKKVRELFEETWEPIQQARSKVVKAMELSGDPEHAKLMAEINRVLYTIKKNARRAAPKQKQPTEPEEEPADVNDF